MNFVNLTELEVILLKIESYIERTDSLCDYSMVKESKTNCETIFANQVNAKLADIIEIQDIIM